MGQNDQKNVYKVYENAKMKKVFLILLKTSILVSLIFNLYSCNLCPNDADNTNFKDELVISYSKLNGNSLLVFCNVLNFSFREIISDISFHSAVADNGDFCFIRKNHQGMNSGLFMGNIFTKNQKLLEIENTIFSIINPVISPKSNAIAFFGGNKQLYIWLNNPINKTSYIDKLTNKFSENTLPLFTPDGQYLCFLEQESNGLTLSVVDINKPDETVKKINFFSQNIIFGQEARLSITEDNRIFFITSDDNNFYCNLIDLNNTAIVKYEISKSVIQIIKGEISSDGTKALLVSNDGVIWCASFKGVNFKLFQITQLDNCLKYNDVRWKKGSKVFIAFRTNCDNTYENTKKLYLVSLDENNDEIKLGSVTYFSSNVVNAYWR